MSRGVIKKEPGAWNRFSSAQIMPKMLTGTLSLFEEHFSFPGETKGSGVFSGQLRED
jgi:hypothetical protein